MSEEQKRQLGILWETLDQQRNQHMQQRQSICTSLHQVSPPFPLPHLGPHTTPSLAHWPCPTPFGPLNALAVALALRPLTPLYSATALPFGPLL